jgi:glutaredoxin-related protein
MSRHILDESKIHPAIQERIANYNRSIVDEVMAALSEHEFVIVGMKGNPHCRHARKQLDSRRIPYRYLEYGSYAREWRRRLALKMWTGWPTFPMVFHEGILLGGASDLAALLESGELTSA